jgi:chorismate synthase
VTAALNPVRVSKADFDRVLLNELRCWMQQRAPRGGVIERVRGEGDSIGGAVECAVLGLPAGVGEPMFEGLENLIAQAVFAIPAVRGWNSAAALKVRPEGQPEQRPLYS